VTPEKFKRKLSAILSADVKGYSRLMGEDEEGTIRTLNAYMEIIAGFVQQHRGRVVATGGDSVLAEFPSVVDAVRCGVGIQEELKDRNKELPEERRMEFRIGVNLGDVVAEGDNILGDGVNVAARMEGLAEAGGICISGTAYDQVKNKLAFGYEYVGEQIVKNIREPVRVYRVLMEPEIKSSLGVAEGKVEKKPRPTRIVALGAVIVFAAVAVIGYFYLRPFSAREEVASKEKMAFPLPEKPSIAVLPFDNMSKESKEEFFSDGITENIITALSKVPQIFVIARNSTFTYKGNPVKVKQVSEELGVQYVIEGSVQKSADRVRITAQLIDALKGHHIWAESYDRELKDIFVLQDEITIKILNGVRVKLTMGGEVSMAQKSAERYYKGKQGLDCYLKLMEANGYSQRFNIQDSGIARRMIEEAIVMCPENPMGYLSLGWVYHSDYYLDNKKSSQETLNKGIELAQKALAMDDSLSGPHGLLCAVYLAKREYDKAIAEGERGVALNPGGTAELIQYAASLCYAGRAEEAIPLFQKAIRLNPFNPQGLY
jgi:adenylate cyclase